jgi:hypothetical protein
MAALAVTALTALAWRSLPSLPLLGPDAWPYLLQAERALADPLALLKERYLDGVWEGARFWRPGFVALGAAELALFGLQPAGFAGCALAALALAGFGSLRLVSAVAGRLATFGGAAAAAIVVLHPVQLETLPALARQADLWASLLVLLTLLALAPGAGAPPWRLAAGVLAAAAAPLFKETGLLAPILGLVLVWPARDDARGPARFVPAAALLLVAGANVGGRIALLGTLGSYDVVLRPVPLHERLGYLVRGILDHQLWGWPLALALVGLLGAAAASYGGWNKAPRSPERRRLVLATVLWSFLVLVALAASERCRMRHAVAAVPPLALACGLWLDTLATRARPRAIAGSIALVSALLAALVPGSPLYAGLGAWRVSGEAAALIIETAALAVGESTVSGSPAIASSGPFRVTASRTVSGTRVTVSPFPYRAAPSGRDRRDARIESAMILMPYSVEAALALRGLSGQIAVSPDGANWSVTRETLLTYADD